MEGLNLTHHALAVGIYLFSSNLKGVSSMRLHHELVISQKALWFMLHRLRPTFEADEGPFVALVEVDETYMGGKCKSMPNHKPEELTGLRAVGKMAVVGAKDHATDQVSVEIIQSNDRVTPRELVTDRMDWDAKIYIDDAIPRKYQDVKYAVGEFVRGQDSTNGVESFWSIMKRGYGGTYHTMSPKHLNRYVKEFDEPYNDCDIAPRSRSSAVLPTV